MKGICSVTILASLIAFLSIAAADPALLDVPATANTVLDTTGLDVAAVPYGDLLAKFLTLNSGSVIDDLVKSISAFAEGVRIIGDIFLPTVAAPFRDYLSALIRVALCVTRNGTNNPKICDRGYNYTYEGVTYTGDPKNATEVFETFRANSIRIRVEDAFLQGFVYEPQHNCSGFPSYGEFIIDSASALRRLSMAGNNFTYDDVQTAVEKITEAFAIGGESFQRGLGDIIINGIVYFVNNFTPQYDFIPINATTIRTYVNNSEVTLYQPFLSDSCNRATLMTSKLTQ